MPKSLAAVSANCSLHRASGFNDRLLPDAFVGRCFAHVTGCGLVLYSAAGACEDRAEGRDGKQHEACRGPEGRLMAVGLVDETHQGRPDQLTQADGQARKAKEVGHPLRAEELVEHQTHEGHARARGESEEHGEAVQCPS